MERGGKWHEYKDALQNGGKGIMYQQYVRRC